MSVKFLSVPSKRLSANLTAAGASFQVNNILKWDGSTNLSAADFGTVGYGVFRDSENTVEFFSFDPSTIASGSIAFINRGLSFEGDLTTETAAYKLSWIKNETIVEFGSHPPQLFQWLKEYIDDASIAGAVNATNSVKGIVEIATASEIDADTSTGATGAAVATTPDQLALSKYARGTDSYNYVVDESVTDAYAITVAPAPSEYVEGQTFKFKAGTANTGACTLNVNGLGAKDIKKFGSFDTVTGDIVVGQIVTVQYDGTNFQMQTPTTQQVPVTTLYTTAGTQLGSSTTQFDITNTAGNTYRYIWDTTGTDPSFSAANNPVGSLIYFNCQNFNAGNNGLFLVTDSGVNFVEITNASGVAESNKTIGTGNLQRQTAVNGTYTKTSGLKYISVRQTGGGANGIAGGTNTSNAAGSSAGYAEKVISATSLSDNEYFIVGAVVNDTVFRLKSSSPVVTTGARAGSGTTPGAPGTATGGDINIAGSGGQGGLGNSGGGPAVLGAPTPLGNGGGNGTTTGSTTNATGYGAGGAGGGTSDSAGQAAGTGAPGVLIITEHFV